VNDRVVHMTPGRTVLIIEDDQGIGKMLVALLTAEGYRPTLVADGGDAMDAIRDLQPSVITLDLSLPTVDGFEILDQLDDDALRGVPVVVVSAYTEQLTTAHRERAAAVLTKPFEIDTLLSCLSAALMEA